MSSIFDLRFIVVAGKGGAGRTTISAALAVAAARRGKRVLIAMCNSKERLSHLLEVNSIGPNIQYILPNIEAVNMEPKAALEEYGMIILKLRALYRFIFENRYVAAIMRGSPGLEAWALLGKAQFHVREMDEENRPRYDLVILDAPATGHGLDLLRIPRVIIEAAPPGLLRREAETAWDLFTDSHRSGICLVTLAEELSVSETSELYQSLTVELKLPVCCLVVNQLLPNLFTAEERLMFDRFAKRQIDDPYMRFLLHGSRLRAQREAAQQSYNKRLYQTISEPHIEVPALVTPNFRRSEIEVISRIIDGYMP